MLASAVTGSSTAAYMPRSSVSVNRQGSAASSTPYVTTHVPDTAIQHRERPQIRPQDQAGHAPTTTAIAKTNNKARRRQVQALDEEEF